MRIKYSFPVQGTLRVVDGSSIELSDFTFRFETDTSTGYVIKLVIEIANIEKERWPTLTQIKQDPNASIPQFPFATNPNTVLFSEIEPQVTNLESYLSIFGLEAIDFGRIAVEWLPDPNDELTAMNSSWSIKPSSPEPLSKPLTDLTLSRCIV